VVTLSHAVLFKITLSIVESWQDRTRAVTRSADSTDRPSRAIQDRFQLLEAAAAVAVAVAAILALDSAADPMPNV
jgi:hypothetical protein